MWTEITRPQYERSGLRCNSLMFGHSGRSSDLANDQTSETTRIGSALGRTWREK